MKTIDTRHAGSVLFCIFMLTAAATAQAANVGYYDMCVGQGNANQVAPITAAGHTPVNITDLNPGELAAIDLLFVDNCSNSSYGAEYLGALSNIETAVGNGMALMIHDRYVTPAETILPGGGSFNILRDFGDDADINVIDNSTVLTNGPGGIVDDTTLDNGNSSSHGYAVLGSLPGSGTFLLSRGDPSEIVSFSYDFNAGCVYYSSIPLDYYLSGNTPAAFSTVYAVNAVAYGFECSGTSRGPAVPVPTLGVWGLLLLSSMVLMLGLLMRRRIS